MKPLHIILVIIAGIGVAAVVSLYGNTTKNVTFKDAIELAKENPGKDYVVRCKLNKNKAMEYDAQKDANKLIFYASDSLGYEVKVMYNQPKPTDMERSDMITLTGHMEGNMFKASEIAMKCPSKYEDAPVSGGTGTAGAKYPAEGSDSASKPAETKSNSK